MHSLRNAVRRKARRYRLGFPFSRGVRAAGHKARRYWMQPNPLPMLSALCPMPHALCPMPCAPCPMLYALYPPPCSQQSVDRLEAAVIKLSSAWNFRPPGRMGGFQ